MFEVLWSTGRMRRDLELEATIVEKYVAVEAFLDERGRRIYGRPRSRVPSGMEEMRWCRLRQGCRVQPSGRGAGSWLAAMWCAVGCVARVPDGPASSSRSRALSTRWRRWLTRLTRGDPESPLRWTCKSRAKFTAGVVAGWVAGEFDDGESFAA